MEIDYPEYHHQGMGCGLEDRGVTDRYEAMQYGWDEAAERYESEVVEPLVARIEELESLLKKLWYDCSNGQKSAIDIVLKGNK